MAVLARSSITLVTSVDIDSVYWFYLLQASTAAAPAKPTTVPATKGNAPSGWTTAEPTTVDINKTLYRVELTYFTDGTGVYSSVNQVSSYEAAKVAYNKAADVQTNLDDAYDKLQSMGEQLVVNGSAFTGDNTNFSTWTFDGSVANGTKGSFTKPSNYAGTPMTDETFPIDITKRYRFEFDAKSKNKTARHYSFLNFYDVDGNTIYANQHMFIANTLTTLSQDLKNGDTVVHLADLTNWKTSTGTATHQRGLIFWNYKNSFGYQYPELTYSRNTWSNLYTDANVNKTAKTITLSGPWSHGTIPAGTKVSQSNSGANYKYNPWSNSLVETEWTHYVGYYDGTDYSGNNVQTKFPPGAATAKVGFLWNYQSQSTTDQLWITNVSVMEDLKTSISNAQTTANNAATAASTAQTTANSASTAAATAQATADAKKSMIKINTATRSFTTANWKTYGVVGHSENWATGSSYSNPNIKVGDTAYLVGTVSDGAKGSATIIGTVTAVNGTNGTTSITMTSQQLIFGGDSVDNVNTTANTAKTTADEAKTAATNAQTTANDAKTTAQNAESRVRFKGAIKANNASGYGAITAGNIIVGTSAGYHHLKLGKQFDINYPILYCGTNIASGGTKDDNYTVYPVTITTTQNITLAPYKAVYIKGTLAGSLFTPASTTPLTQTEPTSASDTNYYMRLGLAYDSTHMYLEADHPIYRWSAGAFRLFGSSADEIVRAWCKDTTVTTIGGMEINGAHMATKSIEADSVNVTDLSAFGATIGGFVIDADSIHTIGYGRTSFDYSSIVVGSFNTDGSENDDAKRARSPFLDDNVTNIYNDEDTGDYTFTLLAWEKDTDEFKGYLTNNSTYVFLKNASSVVYVDHLNMTAIRNANPTYKFRLLVRTTSAPNSNINITSARDDLWVPVDNSNNIKLSKVDYSNVINSNTRSDWRFNIGSYFGVTKDGYLYAFNANISGSGTFGGTINANSGRIGNWTIGSYQSSAPSSAAETKGSLYTGIFGSAGGIYLIPRGTTTSKTIGGGTATDWRFAIGANFGVRNDGTVYANAAKINGSSTFNGSITATTVRTTANVGADYNGLARNRWDHIVIFNCAGCSLSEFQMNGWNVGDGFKPTRDIYMAAAINVNNGGVWKLAVVRVQTNGTITIYWYNSYGGAANAINSSNYTNSSWSNSSIFCNGSWITNDTTYPTIGT